MRLIITVTLLSLLSWPRLNLAPTAYADVPEVASHTAQEGVPIELLTLGVVEAADRWGADEYAMLRAATSAGLWLRVDGCRTLIAGQQQELSCDHRVGVDGDGHHDEGPRIACGRIGNGEAERQAEDGLDEA